MKRVMKSQVLDNPEGCWATIGGDLPNEGLRSYIATVNDILYLVGGESSDLILEWDPVEEEWLEAGHLSTSAQCAFWVVRWPSSQMAIAIKTLSHGKTIVLRLFFLYCFRKKTLKLVSLFIFRH